MIASSILWLLYTVYEYYIATGVLCDKDCNIRVDLVFFFPILWLATYCAYQSYMGRPGQAKIIGMVLGAIGLFVFAFWAEGHGYGTLSSVVIVAALIGFGFYAIRSRSKSKPESKPKPESTSNTDRT